MIQDRIAAAKKIDAFLKNVITSGAFKLKYRITVHPPSATAEPGAAEITVDLAGPDSDLVLERGAEMLRSLEILCHEALHLHPEDYSRFSFDCLGYRTARQQELNLSTQDA